MKIKVTKKHLESGITLISLVITIIVLIILAAVSINAIAGDGGIIEQAQLARERTEKENTLERLKIAILEALTNGTGEIDYNKLDTSLKKEFGESGYNITNDSQTGKWVVTIEKYKYQVTNTGNVAEIDTTTAETIPVAGKYYSADTKVKIGGKTVSIPGGATLSGITGEYEDVSNGIVIYMTKEEVTNIDWTSNTVKETYDQFVWIPVDNPVAVDKDNDKSIDSDDIDAMIASEQYPMAIEIGEDSSGNKNYRGILYDFKLSTDETKVEISDKTWSNTQTNNVEPRPLNVDSTIDTAKDSIQSAFNTMVNEVISEGGFWVGRYETTSIYGNSPKIIKGTNTNISEVPWNGMHTSQAAYITNSGLNLKTSKISSMIWGSQWDQIMIWMRNEKNESQSSFYIVNSIGMANYNVSDVNDGHDSTREPANTGCFGVKNVFDLAGNVYEWTLESDGDKSRVQRGGAYASGTTTSWASYRKSGDITQNALTGINNIGTRMTLY